MTASPNLSSLPSSQTTLGKAFTAPYPAMALVGPTASGKSSLAMFIAKHYPIEIISVDSALVYQGMDIGTAKPSQAEQAEVPHHLIDILSPREVYSAAQFAADSLRLIGEIQSRGNMPLLVGGTMLYIKALREGLHDLPSSDVAIRAQVSAEALRHGWPAMHARLAELDPETAARLKPFDSQRVGRAIEVYLQTGKTLSSYLQSQDKMLHAREIAIPLISLEPDRRAWLHDRIAKRFELMLAQGLLNEVRQVYASLGNDANLPSMRCVGYRQVIDAMEARESWESVSERAIAATRQLAKRQLTWLRSMQREVLSCEAVTEQPELLLPLIARFHSK